MRGETQERAFVPVQSYPAHSSSLARIAWRDRTAPAFTLEAKGCRLWTLVETKSCPARIIGFTRNTHSSWTTSLWFGFRPLSSAVSCMKYSGLKQSNKKVLLQTRCSLCDCQIPTKVRKITFKGRSRWHRGELIRTNICFPTACGSPRWRSFPRMTAPKSTRRRWSRLPCFAREARTVPATPDRCWWIWVQVENMWRSGWHRSALQPATNWLKVLQSSWGSQASSTSSDKTLIWRKMNWMCPTQWMFESLLNEIKLLRWVTGFLNH